MKNLILTISILFFGIQTFAQSPIISVTPDSLSETLFIGKTSNQLLTISNNGNSDLTFNISTEFFPSGNDQNYALQFDGVNDMVEGSSAGFPVGNSDRTVELWFRRISQPVYGGQLLGYGSWGNYEQAYTLSIGNDRISFSQWGSGVDGNTIIESNKWYHFAVVNVGNEVKLYLNGELDGSGNININTVSNGLYYIGKAPPGFDVGDRRFNGVIDDVRIWDVARTQQEIQQSMKQELDRSEQGLVGYWKFNEGTGDTTYDMTTNANHGSLSGGATWINSTSPIITPWLSFDPDAGVCLPNSSLEVGVSFNAFGRASGNYDDNIIISSNDPITPEVIVPAHLSVVDAPAFYVETDSINFGEVFLGVKDTFYLEVRNVGSQDLLIFSATIQPAQYNVHPTFAGIDPGDSEIFTLTFLPQIVGNYPGTLTFNNNDPIYDNYILNISGQGVEPPVILFSPDSIFAEVLQGEIVTKQLLISNQGGSNLYFDIVGGFSERNFTLQFDGINDYVDVTAANSLNFVNEVTIEAWFKWTGEGSDNWPAIVCKGQADSENYALFINKWGSLIHFVINTEYGRQFIESPYNGILPNIWHYVAATYDGSIVKINVDGQLVSEQPITGALITNEESFLIGCRDASGSFFNGQIDELRIWNVARTQEDINQYMNQELKGSEQGLVGYWKFNEGIGDTAYDMTTNENNGSLKGGSYWIESSAPIKPSWLSASPDSGICWPNSSMDIEILFDATEVDSGNFNGSIIITSNDPVNPAVIVPVRMIVTPVVGVDDEERLPREFALEQNYPNPFNPNTKIKYSVPHTSNVELKVFDILGNEIETLVNEEKPAGTYEVTWYADGLPSGVYFYQLKASNYIETKKMLLLK